jgi:hypothetical protein
MKLTCSSCGITYRVISDEAEYDELEPIFCPFCSEEHQEELDFNDD